MQVHSQEVRESIQPIEVVEERGSHLGARSTSMADHKDHSIDNDNDATGFKAPESKLLSVLSAHMAKVSQQEAEAKTRIKSTW